MEDGHLDIELKMYPDLSVFGLNTDQNNSECGHFLRSDYFRKSRMVFSAGAFNA